MELWWFVNQLPRNSRYWAARSRDVELYKLATARGHKARRSPPPEIYEYSSEQEYLAIVAQQLHNIAYLIANQNTPKRKRKKYKPLKLPRPETAADVVHREQARDAYDYLESVVRFVPDDEWLAQQKDNEDSLTRDT